MEVFKDIGDRPPLGFMPDVMFGNAMTMPSVDAIAAWLEESLTQEELQTILEDLKKQNGGESLQTTPPPEKPSTKDLYS